MGKTPVQLCNWWNTWDYWELVTVNTQMRGRRCSAGLRWLWGLSTLNTLGDFHTALSSMEKYVNWYLLLNNRKKKKGTAIFNVNSLDCLCEHWGFQTTSWKFNFLHFYNLNDLYNQNLMHSHLLQLKIQCSLLQNAPPNTFPPLVSLTSRFPLQPNFLNKWFMFANFSIHCHLVSAPTLQLNLFWLRSPVMTAPFSVFRNHWAHLVEDFLFPEASPSSSMHQNLLFSLHLFLRVLSFSSCCQPLRFL